MGGSRIGVGTGGIEVAGRETSEGGFELSFVACIETSKPYGAE